MNSSGVEYDPTAGGLVLEVTLGGGAGATADSDGDGVADVADDFPSDPTRWHSVDDDGFYHLLPFGGPTEIDPLEFDAEVTTADIYFLIDDSGSMSGEIAALRDSLTTGTLTPGCPGGIIGSIACTIPNSLVGVGSFEEYPVDPYGKAGNIVFKHHQDMTLDTTAALAAVSGITTNGNKSDPEAAMQAMYATVTGEGLNRQVSTRTGCPAGTWGYGCFRDDTIPIVMLFTDAPFHNGPMTQHDYDRTMFPIGLSLPPPTTSSVAGNDLEGTAHPIGEVVGEWLGFQGSTAALGDDYADCGSGGSPDAYFTFDVGQTTNVQLTTEGSSFDTTLAVYKLATLPVDVDFSTNPTTAYESGQDGNGTTTVEDGGQTLRLSGNRWRRFPVGYEVTANTVLEFDYRAAAQGEIQAIGIEGDNDFDGGGQTLFQLYGADVHSAFSTDYYDYSGTAWKSYSIPVGTYWTGTATHVAFVADDDGAEASDSYYRNVRIYEAGPPASPGAPTCADGMGTSAAVTLDFNASPPGPYSPSTQDGQGGLPTAATIEDGGATLRVTGNAWKRVLANYTVTTETVLEFDFQFTTNGELFGIGVDTDDDYSTGTVFQLGGTDVWTGADQTYNNYPGSGWVHYRIPLGNYVTGAHSRVVFFADDDGAGAADCRFRNVQLYDVSYGDSERLDLNLTPGRYVAVVSGKGGTSGDYQLNVGTALLPRWRDTVAAMQARGVKTIVVESNEDEASRIDVLPNAITLANVTNSVDGLGNPYVFRIGADGAGLSSAVVDAVTVLANFTRFDVTATALDNPATGFDETGFVDAITPVTWGPGHCLGTLPNGFAQCTPGTEVDFTVSFRNDLVMPGPTAQVFEFDILVQLDGSTQKRVPVRIVVPPAAASFPSSGAYWRDYDTTVRCGDDLGSKWGSLRWVTTTPTDTAVAFEFRTAATAAEVAGATPLVFSIPPHLEADVVDLSAAVLGAGMPDSFPYGRVTAVLYSSPAGTETPVLREFRLDFECVANE